VADEPDIEMNLARRMRGSGLPSRPALEINPEHALVQRLDREPDEERLSDWAHILYSQSVLTLGARIEDPADFVDRLNGLLMTLAEKTD
jgi:molecular chaperone HtpG